MSKHRVFSSKRAAEGEIAAGNAAPNGHPRASGKEALRKSLRVCETEKALREQTPAYQTGMRKVGARETRQAGWHRRIVCLPKSCPSEKMSIFSLRTGFFINNLYFCSGAIMEGTCYD